MDKRIAVSEWMNVCKSIRSAKEKWEKIGVGLGLEHDTLREINTNNQGEPGKCLYAAVDAWLRCKGVTRSTWRVLIRTLESAEVDEAALAERLISEKGFVRLASTTLQKPKVSVEHEEEEFTGEVKLDLQDLAWLLNQLTSVASNWFDFGLYLKIHYKDLQIIRHDNHDCVSCLRETLAFWLTQKPTSGQLLKALNMLQERQLSWSLKQSLSQGDHRKEVPQMLQVNILERYLRSFYTNSLQLGGTTEWPPTLEVEYINLQLVPQKNTLRHQEKLADLSKRGEIGAALEQNEPLLLKDITNYASPRKVIIIEGAPGVGKTTLAYKLCRDWANRELLTEFSLVLYIPLRVPLMRVAESADDLLQYFEKKCSPADIQSIKQSQGNGVLFILDGWDELRPSCRLPDSFFPKLIRGEFLPESSVIVTSRPGAIDHGIRHPIANRLVEILGFTEEQVTQYIHSYFKNHDGAAQKLIEDLQAYPNVASTCYVAINLNILCYVYYASDFQLPSTLTEVYEQFVIHAIKRHFERETKIKDNSSVGNVASVQAVSGFGDSVSRILNGLGRLALEGLERGDLSFTSGEVISACHLSESEEFDGFGLLKILFVFRRHGSQQNYQFLHLTVQEYLAAYTISQMNEYKQRMWLRSNLSNDTFEKVFKFFCGMYRFRPCTARDIFSSFLAAPFVLECIFEGQWEEECKMIAEETSSKLIITGKSHIPPYRALVYGYVMTTSKTQWHLQWKECNIGEHELKSLGRHLLSSTTTLTQISLVQSSFSSKEAADLFAKIIHSQEQLSELTLTGAGLDDSCLACICKALAGHQTLKTINLSQNSLSERSTEDIALLIMLPSLKSLDLSGNNLGEYCCRSILQNSSASISLQVLHLPFKTDALLLEYNQVKAQRKDKGLDELIVLFS